MGHPDPFLSHVWKQNGNLIKLLETFGSKQLSPRHPQPCGPGFLFFLILTQG